MTAELSVPRLTHETTAFEWLTGDLVAIIREEPKRIWMSTVISTSDDEMVEALVEALHNNPGDDRYADFFDNDYDGSEVSTNLVEERLLPERRPACGTAACIAGWTLVAVAGRRTWAQAGSWQDWQDQAADILGLDQLQSTQLFMPRDLCEDPEQGTPEFAERVIAHVLDFCARNKEQLKAHRVVPS
jgi:hypothetical protein